MDLVRIDIDNDGRSKQDKRNLSVSPFLFQPAGSYAVAFVADVTAVVDVTRIHAQSSARIYNTFSLDIAVCGYELHEPAVPAVL